MRRPARFVAVATAVLGSFGLGTAATAAPVETVVAGEHLRLVSVADAAAMAAMSPGATAVWDVGVGVSTPGDATVDVSLEVLSATPDAFEVTVQRCAVRWSADGGCPGGAVPLTTAQVEPGGVSHLDRTDADHDPWYRVAVTFVGDAGGAETTLRLHAVGAGEEVSADGGGSGEQLPGTGVSPWWGVAAAGASVLTGVGLASLAGRARRRAERHG